MDPGAFPEERIREMVSRVAAYLREEREVYVRHSEPLSADLRAWIQGYFPDELLGPFEDHHFEGSANTAAAVLR